eukprot:NODE_246_length_12992_cov_0.264407.p2 type:complete len:463 gc:universal NODE_246_length_12992_cov_0.264407:2562-1174(-)
MKLKLLSHQPTRERSQDHHILQRSLSSHVHPFQKEREFKRALNCAKTERLLAKPFVKAMALNDRILSIDTHKRDLGVCVANSLDEIVIWDTQFNSVLHKIKNPHDGICKNISCVPFDMQSTHFVSCGSDQFAKLWTTSNDPVQVYKGDSGFNSVDCNISKRQFASASDVLNIWDFERDTPVEQILWGSDTLQSVKYNPCEPHLIAAAGKSRSVIIYDVRSRVPVHKVVLEMSVNNLSWNPMEAMNFAVANEDGNSYLFDIRNLKRASNIYKGHVNAVLDIDFCPTGKEVVTCSYDKSIRIFPTIRGRSRDIYHTSRMQRCFSVRYSRDGKYIYSGSDDANIRVWKSNAAEKINTTGRERAHINYMQALKEKFKSVPELKKIDQHRRLPKYVYKEASKKFEMEQSRKRKERNIIKHSSAKHLLKLDQVHEHDRNTVVEDPFQQHIIDNFRKSERVSKVVKTEE